MEELPHICFVSDTIHSYFTSDNIRGTGGAERQQYLLATGLAERDYDVSIATLRHNSTRVHSLDSIDVCRAIPDVRGVHNAPYKALLTLRCLKRISADVYYVRGNDFLCMITAGFARMSDSGFIYSVANDANIEPNHLARRGFIRHPYLLAMRSADSVVAQTKHQQRILKSEHHIDSRLIPNGYPIPPEGDILPHDSRDHVLWVGSIDPIQKKPERFLNLSREFPNVRFRMIGPPDNDNPDYYHEIASIASELSNVEFLGYVEPDKIHYHYRTAIALVNTSDYEGFPNTFLEAWQYGTPVVSLFFEPDDILSTELAGIYAGSMDRLEGVLDRLVSDPELCEEVGASGREHLEANHSLDDMIERYEQVFESVTQRNI